MAFQSSPFKQLIPGKLHSKSFNFLFSDEKVKKTVILLILDSLEKERIAWFITTQKQNKQEPTKN